MGTRCVTVFKNKQLNWDTNEPESVEVCRFYRHWDGYPDGHGADIARSVIEANDDTRKNNRNWAQHVLARLFSCVADMELEERDQRHGDLDYIYVVEGSYANYGGKQDVPSFDVTITCYRVSWDDGLIELFSGDAEQFLDWAMEGGE